MQKMQKMLHEEKKFIENNINDRESTSQKKQVDKVFTILPCQLVPESLLTFKFCNCKT